MKKNITLREPKTAEYRARETLVSDRTPFSLK